MRSIKQLLLFGILLLSVAGIAVGQEKSESLLNVKYDKKKNVTTVRLKSMKLTPVVQQDQSSYQIPVHQVLLDVSTSFEGEKPTKPVDVLFRFQVSAGNYIFLRSQAGMAVLDKEGDTGRAIPLGNSDYKSYSPKFNSVYEETLVVTAPAEALQKMVSAKTVHIYLGPVGYALAGKGQLEGIKELAQFLTQASQAKPN